MNALQTGSPVSPAGSQNPAPLPPVYYPNGNPNAPDNPANARATDSCLPLHPRGPVEHHYDVTGPAPGDLAFRWIHGSVVAAKNDDPRVQVLAYNEDTYMLRENPCVHWEAPFTYLLFGNTGALLIDTGATPEAAYYPLRATVDAVIARWCTIRGRRSIPLTVVLTSGEDEAQNQGLGQFAGRPETRLAPTDLAGMKAFYGFGAWPDGVGTIDLGGRVVDVLPTPGAHQDGVTFYDRYNDLLHTGDLLYPGRILIGNDQDYVASLGRLKAWSEQHPVKWVMGGHVEMMFVPGRAYPRFANNRPFEHALQLEASSIGEALEQAQGMVGKPGVVFRRDFILLNRVGPDEDVYKTPPDMPDVDVPFWLP